jgi:HSP20 family protein
MTRTKSPELGRFDPLAELQCLDQHLSRYLGSLGPIGITPRAGVEETGDAYVVELELPGVKEGDIDISLSGRRLTVSGERKQQKRAGILRRGTTASVRRFHYDVVLPSAVDAENVNASLDDGVLTVRVPKPENERPRRIEVR